MVHSNKSIIDEVSRKDHAHDLTPSVMYGNTYSRHRRARDVRRAAERVQRVEGAAQESQELSRG